MTHDLRRAAALLGGEVTGGQIVCPGPGHGPRDRSLAVRFMPDGDFTTHSFAGDDWRACRDYVRALLGLGDREPNREPRPSGRTRTMPKPDDGDRIALARYLWKRRQPIAGTPAVNYLLSRGYNGIIPATIAYLPPSPKYPEPAMLAAFGITSEPEPGALAIADNAVRAVHLTRLLPDGSDRERGPDSKITVASPGGAPILLAPMNDALSLAICEGIEDALSVHSALSIGAWAAGSASFMPSLAEAVPSYTDSVSIFAHADQAGERGAAELAVRLAARGLHVEIIRLGRFP